jgi:hypothetical protein
MMIPGRGAGITAVNPGLGCFPRISEARVVSSRPAAALFSGASVRSSKMRAIVCRPASSTGTKTSGVKLTERLCVVECVAEPLPSRLFAGRWPCKPLYHSVNHSFGYCDVNRRNR